MVVPGLHNPTHREILRLFSYVIDDKVSINDVVRTADTSNLFHLPLSTQAFSEFQQLTVLLDGISLNEEVHDSWSWPTKSGDYTAKSFYMMNFEHVQVDPIFKWIWRCACTLKLRVFGWLLLMDRLNTRNMTLVSCDH